MLSPKDFVVRIAESRLSFFSFLFLSSFLFLFYFPFVLFLTCRVRISDDMNHMIQRGSRRMTLYHIEISWLTHGNLR